MSAAASTSEAHARKLEAPPSPCITSVNDGAQTWDLASAGKRPLFDLHPSTLHFLKHKSGGHLSGTGVMSLLLDVVNTFSHGIGNVAASVAPF